LKAAISANSCSQIHSLSAYEPGKGSKTRNLNPEIGVYQPYGLAGLLTHSFLAPSQVVSDSPSGRVLPKNAELTAAGTVWAFHPIPFSFDIQQVYIKTKTVQK
jgi:hypothetical protein